ncbi:hypothetical protein ACLI1A_03860 [Flavobacterium sp. RHBU_3]|uniref:hypothetical protein n=1 Tax=Flavobacterium sp. RHBU_3 TaxID=3391184 RepID=UPI0039850BFE
MMKFGIALVAMLATVSTYANDNDFLVKAKEGAGKAISFTVTETKNVHVALYAKDGAEIFDETVKSKDGKINRTYDLNALPDGTYYLETETAEKVARHEITISGKVATVNEKAVTEIAKPVIFTKDGIVTVQVTKNDTTPVDIKVYDEANNELYSEKFEGEKVAKRFDITKSAAKKFTLVIGYSNKTFVETVAAR